ncbi:MFS transporter [Pseudoclavibacter sp. Z016]|uniref:MFS transporter n=1 Tax=Pseudoclavibacter sp. Z016 TaxID=2080581 RepID=UPI000CE89F92|nr:MFS transporter [Pseudoclavibacter sp. Z016]
MNRGTRALLAVICGVAVASIYASQPVLGQMGRELSVPVEAVGWLVAAAQLGYLVGLILLVPLGDLLNRRRLIVVHLVLLAGALALVAAAPVAWVAFAGLASTGMLAVVVQTVVAYAAALSDPAERGRTLGVVTSGVVIGILGSRILSGALADLWGWRSMFVALAVLAVGLAAVALFRLRADSRTVLVPPYLGVLRSFFHLLAQPSLLGRGAIAFFLFASFGALWSGMTVPLAGAPWHLSETLIGVVGIAGLTGALGAARAGRWADAGHANRVAGIALVVLLASWLLIAQLTWSLILLLLGVVVLDFAVQAVHVSNQHILTSADPGRVSTTIGAYMVFYSLGSATGAASTTAVYAWAGWHGSAMLGAAFAAAGLVAWVLASSVRRASHATEGMSEPRPRLVA